MKLRLYSRQSYLFLQTVAKRTVERILLLAILCQPKCKKKIRPEAITKIVVPLFSGIGDAVILTTCLQQLTSLFPDAEISIVETNRTKDILRDTYPEMNFIMIKSLRELRSYKNHYDLMISPSRNIDHYLAALMLRPKFLVGYNYSLSIKKKESHIERSNRLLKQLGYNGFNNPVLKLSDAAIEHASDIIHHEKVVKSARKISLIIGGRWPSKVYPTSYYKNLITVISKNHDVVFFLIGNDSQIGERLAAHDRSVRQFSGKVSLNETMGIIYHSDLIIGPDGGLLNIAIAFNKPIIGLFGAVDPGTIVPQQYLSQTLFIHNCPFQPCYNEEHEPLCRMERPVCIEISATNLVKRIEEFLSK